MANLFNDVQPGDLITSSFWNQVLQTLNSFNDRITALESGSAGGGALTISGIYPSGSISVGDTISILGKNFGLPSSDSVNINGTSVGQPLAGSNNTQLIIKIPNLPSIPQAGQFVTLTVSNTSGFATISFLLLPGQSVLPTGTLYVNFGSTPVSPPDPLVAAGKSYIFTFTVIAITSLNETYTLTPTLSQATWSAVVVDNSGNPVSPSQVLIPQGNPPNGTTQNVRVMVTIPAGAATGASSSLNLSVTSKLNPTVLTKSGSLSSSITVGSPPPGGQDEILVSYNTVFAPGSASGGVVTIPPTSAKVRVDFTALIQNAGDYTIAAPVVQGDPTNLWTAQLQVPQALTPTTANSNNLVTISLAAQPGAPAATLVMAVSSNASPSVIGAFSQSIVAGTGSTQK
jgi:hypothetical protein